MSPRVSMWRSALLVTAILVALLLLVAPLGTRGGLWNFEVGLRGLLAVLIGGGLTALLAAGTFAWAHSKKHSDVRTRAAASFLIALLPALFVAMQIQTARSLPLIHDISTDTVNPPVFTSAVILDAERDNPLEYGGEEIAAQQLAAYPMVQAIASTLSTAAAFERALAVAAALEWEVTAEDPAAGRIEAIDTTFWFGFKDDIAIRVIAEGTGSRLDLRSISRVGLSDVGANAARIEAFIKQFGA